MIHKYVEGQRSRLGITWSWKLRSIRLLLPLSRKAVVLQDNPWTKEILVAHLRQRLFSFYLRYSPVAGLVVHWGLFDAADRV